MEDTRLYAPHTSPTDPHLTQRPGADEQPPRIRHTGRCNAVRGYPCAVTRASILRVVITFHIVVYHARGLRPALFTRRTRNTVLDGEVEAQAVSADLDLTANKGQSETLLRGGCVLGASPLAEPEAIRLGLLPQLRRVGRQVVSKAAGRQRERRNS